LITRILKTS